MPNVRTFGSTTRQLHELADWLASEGVVSVAMESTHVDWIPLHELLEERGFEVTWLLFAGQGFLQLKLSRSGRACSRCPRAILSYSNTGAP